MKSLLSSIGVIFMALSASTCCVGPLLALAGTLGISASHIIWLSSVKNYLIVFSLLAIAYNLYQAYFSTKEKECCDYNYPELTQAPLKSEQGIILFLRSKTFLWIVTAITLFILILPYILN